MITSRLVYEIADLTIKVEADFPLTSDIFTTKFSPFESSSSRSDQVVLRHYFSLPKLDALNPDDKAYHFPPWAIYRRPDGWLYLGIAAQPDELNFHRLAIFNLAHTLAEIYSPDDSLFRRGNLDSLSLFPTDQIWLARVLADRKGCIFHAAGMIINGSGFLFVGHSSAGKSTLVSLLQDEGEILCDDRIALRKWPHDFRIYGTWSHGDVPIVSPASAPLRAICLLEKAPHNRLIPIEDPREIVRTLPFYIVKPLVTVDWWEKTLDLIGAIAREVPVYRLQFDKSGQVRQVIRSLL